MKLNWRVYTVSFEKGEFLPPALSASLAKVDFPDLLIAAELLISNSNGKVEVKNSGLPKAPIT